MRVLALFVKTVNAVFPEQAGKGSGVLCPRRRASPRSALPATAPAAPG